MTLKERLEPVKRALVRAVGSKCYHHFRTGIKPPYVIWAEDNGIGQQADGHKAEQAIEGTIDLFAKTEYDPLFDAIQRELNLEPSIVYWELNSTQYEEETGLTHYEWVWEVM